MWYAVQVYTGMEKRISLQARKVIPKDILEDVIVLSQQEKRHVKEEWIILEKVVFPGYIFVITERIEELEQKLKSVIGMTRLVGTGKEIVPLTDGEIYLLKKFGNQDQVVEMSEGIIENGILMINEGPLKGMEGCVRKIDRHKRKAWVEIEMFHRKQLVQVGLEIVSKSEAKEKEESCREGKS